MTNGREELSQSDEPQEISQSEEYELRKIKMSREVVEQVIKELKYKFWIIAVLIFIIAILGSFLSYIGVSKYLKEAVDDAVKTQIDAKKTQAIVTLLTQNPDFRASVSTKALSQDTFAKNGNEVDCTLSWDTAISQATCPSDSILVGGGCSMTCLGMRHLESIPVAIEGSLVPNAWQCRHAPQPNDAAVQADKAAGRKFHAAAVCLKVKAK